MSTNIEQVVSSFLIRYRKLSELIQYSYSGSNCTDINLYIDLYSVLHRLYSEDVTESSEYSICALLINMCGHYREFFKTLGVSTTIYMVYGRNCPNINLTYVEGYNSKFTTDYVAKANVTEQIDKNLSMLNVLCQYLPNIYFFDIGNCEVSSFIEFIYNNTKANDPKFENIIISRDSLMLQFIPEYNFRLLRPTKSKFGDDSIIVDNSNMWYMYISKYKKTTIPEFAIPNTFISNVLAMSGVVDRGVYSKFSITRCFKIFNQAIQNGYLRSDTIYPQSTINTVLTMMNIPHNDTDLDMRYKAINIHYQSMYTIDLENPKIKRLRLIDLEDNDTIRDIVSKFFIDTPIDLDKL